MDSRALRVAVLPVLGSLSLSGVLLLSARSTGAGQLPERSTRSPELQKKAFAGTSTPLRLVDVGGRPVAGALVSTHFMRYRDRSPSFLPSESVEAKTTDARGEASLALRAGPDGRVGLYAIREEPGQDRPLVGVRVVTRDEIGDAVTITMHPACRVRFRAECPGFGEFERKYNAELDGPTFWRAAYITLGDPRDSAPRILFTNSMSGGELEFLLPPGRYDLNVYGADARWAIRPIEVVAGHRVRSLGVVELSPSPRVTQGGFSDFHHWIQPAPDGGSRVALRRLVDVGLKRPAPNIRGVALSADGSLLASAHMFKEQPGAVKLWDARAGTHIADLPVPATWARIWNVVASPDGKLLAGSVEEVDRAGSQALVALWDVSNRRLVRALEGHFARVNALAFSPDGRTLASGGEDRGVRFWNPATGNETGRLVDQPDPVRWLAYTPDARTLVVWSRNSLGLWAVEGNRLRTTLGPRGFVTTSVALSPDGRTLALAGETADGDGMKKGQVRLYDLSGEPPAPRVALDFDRRKTDQFDRDDTTFSDVVFMADGRSVAAVQMSTVIIWDVASGNVRDYFGKELGRAGDRLLCSPDGRRLIVTDGVSAKIIEITPPPPAPRPSL